MDPVQVMLWALAVLVVVVVLVLVLVMVAAVVKTIRKPKADDGVVFSGGERDG
jgi:hypothetical protein